MKQAPLSAGPVSEAKKKVHTVSTPFKNNRASDSPASSPDDWQHIGPVAVDVVAKLKAARERLRIDHQLMQWDLELSQRIEDRAQLFLTHNCDPSISFQDLEIEWQRFKLALALAKKGRHQ
jgi:hypothetical protein